MVTWRRWRTLCPRDARPHTRTTRGCASTSTSRCRTSTRRCLRSTRCCPSGIVSARSRASRRQECCRCTAASRDRAGRRRGSATNTPSIAIIPTSATSRHRINSSTLTTTRARARMRRAATAASSTPAVRANVLFSCQKSLSCLPLRARSRLVFPLGLGGHGDLEHHQDQRPQHAPSHRQLVARRRDTARRAVQAQCRALPRRGCVPRGRCVPIAHARRWGGLDDGLHVGSGAAGAAQVDQQDVRRLAVRRQPHGQARLL